MAIVILEGIDRVGKTTIRDMLAKEHMFQSLKDETVHSLGSKVDYPSYVQGGIHGITLGIENFAHGLDVVIDRFHFTEWVYGITERGYAPNYTWEIDKRLAEAGVKLILMLPESIDAANERSAEKRQMADRPPVDLTLHQELMEVAFRRSMMGKLTADIHTPASHLLNFIEG